MSSLLFIVGLILSLAVIVYLFFLQKNEIDTDDWKVFAQTHQFHYDTKHNEFKYPAVYGVKETRHFFMGYFVETVSEDIQNRYTLMRLQLRGFFPHGLQIHENIFSSSFTQNLIDRTVVRTLDADFDNKICVKAKNEDDALTYLTPGRKMSIRKLIALKGSLKENGLFYQVENRISGVENINNTFNAFWEIANELDGN